MSLLLWKWDFLLQRLFSTFPDGWPGLGLLLLRVGASIPLVYFGIAGTAGLIGQPLNIVSRIVSAAGGLLLLVGFWTPVAGIALAIDELWIAFLRPVAQLSDHWPHILLAILAAAVAMLGPGAWSVDARLFGRKRFKIETGRNRPH
jgi:putative oxidoreductase